MWIQTPEGDEFVRDLSKQLVEQFAPEELEMFDELYREYQEHPTPEDFQQGSDAPLGSGLGEFIVSVTPAASAMVTAVVSFVLSEVLKAAQNESSERIKAQVKLLFNPKAPQKAAPLTHEQLEKVQKLAAKRAIDFGLSPQQAKQMSLALIGSLSIQ
ncbi:MAG TPA: hypothetical protein VK249_23795 [Anaerolineales bacterium]|nr:hypothetical protein [Anaerolineales bacterium]